MTELIGPLLVMVFCLSQAARDVYFGHLFQRVDFFAVILLAFSLSTVFFGLVALLHTPGEVRALRGHLGTVLAMNASTALAWSCYFYALTYLEPSIVNTVHSAMGPLTVLALAAAGSRLAAPGHLGIAERLAYAGIAASVAALWWVVLSGVSGLTAVSFTPRLSALALLVVSGTSITISLLYAKRLHDHGIGAGTVTAVRYPLLILLAAGVVASNGSLAGIATLGELAMLSMLATVLIALPLFALQVGIARTAPLTAHVIRSLGPVCVFALQQVDGRIAYSTATFVCILAYSACAIAGNLAHGWRDRPAAASAHALARN
jgi:drug/metabolite transporter (DMT)-like permease